jgi:hypothetical protein
MKTTDHAYGKISDHFRGVGTVTRKMVIERAKELAIINGHESGHYTKEDFLEAKRELTGAVPSLTEEGEDEPLASLTTWDEDPGTSGHQVEKNELIDEQAVDELLVEEGVSEAEHEQMVEGAKAEEE